MTDFATAALKFPMAMSSFGVQRLLGALPLADSTAGRTARANLYKAGDSAARDISANAALFGAFQFGDRAQSALIHLASDAVTLKVLRPSYMWNAVSEFIDASNDVYESVATSDSRRLLGEQVSNTFDVIGFMNQHDLPTELSADGSYPIAEMLERQYGRGDYPAVWLVTALGECYTQAFLNDGRILHGLLSSGEGLHLPEKSQLMLHSGMGMAIARLAIGRLTPCSTPEELDGAVKMFLDTVEDNSQPAYKPAALEALGFVTRMRYGQLVGLVHDGLAALNPVAAEYFWHGVGRAIYFSPVSLLPGFSPWHAAEQEPPHETARRNTRAGLAWAFTLVNLRQPEITANFLQHRPDDISTDDSFTSGVYSALIVAAETVPGHRFVTGYCRYHQDPDDDAAVDAWHRFIGINCETRVREYRQILRARGQFAQLFRHQRLQDFVDSLNPVRPGSSTAGHSRKM